MSCFKEEEISLTPPRPRMAKGIKVARPASSRIKSGNDRKHSESVSTNYKYWPSLGGKDTIPKWLQDNEFILTGHPMPTYSYQKSLRLWRCLHMEFMNIWTHLLASSAFLVTGGVMYYEIYQSPASAGDLLAFAAFIFSAAICFGLSAAFHTLRSHSYRVHHFWGKMDILGICILALGAGVSATYYTTLQQSNLRTAYWGLSVCSSTAAAFTLYETGGGGSKMRSMRGGVFSLLALSAMLPIFHGVAVRGWQTACLHFGAHWFMVEGVFLLLGVGTFIGRYPERLCPGLFDIWGHSHQIFHTCAALGTVFHLLALIAGYRYRHSADGHGQSIWK